MIFTEFGVIFKDFMKSDCFFLLGFSEVVFDLFVRIFIFSSFSLFSELLVWRLE